MFGRTATFDEVDRLMEVDSTFAAMTAAASRSKPHRQSVSKRQASTSAAYVDTKILELRRSHDNPPL